MSKKRKGSENGPVDAQRISPLIAETLKGAILYGMQPPTLMQDWMSNAQGAVVRLHLLSGTVLTGRWIASDARHYVIGQYEDTPILVERGAVCAMQLLTDAMAKAEVARWKALAEAGG